MASRKAAALPVFPVLFAAWVGVAAPPPPAPPVPRPPLASPATLMVENEVAVSTRVSGVVESIDAERGESVRKGQALATLDQREFRLDLKAAEETLAVQQADFRRAEELFRQSLISAAEFEQKRSRFELAKVELERARLVIDRSVVRAPFDGVVADRFVRMGEKVLVDESRPLFRVSALEPLLARTFLPGSALPSLKAGREVVVLARDDGGVRSTGSIVFVSPVLDAASGTVQVIVRVRRDTKGLLRPGTAVQLLFPAGAVP